MECHTLTTSFIATTVHVPQLSIHLQVSIVLTVKIRSSITDELQLNVLTIFFVPGTVKKLYGEIPNFYFQQMLTMYF